MTHPQNGLSSSRLSFTFGREGLAGVLLVAFARCATGVPASGNSGGRGIQPEILKVGT
jgi:hypothetical protein